ncbi:Uncharacterized conserved protein YdaU, DUF1376 family [Nitrosomonas aestuarii]|uniref:Uncharacterized conserved protein YdaU, DUF1376 family n=1 Tax=Nitrosomonas aestuarii TaxID=52441 RepID=A0A1I4E6V2_9PROT|nr:hypothetical protein [Nitrosomonas aestuarii]SFL01538.1 Uncharacterized conserved protein YdaU, DUF1376 family [Nitrosomonas aestuarii]
MAQNRKPPAYQEYAATILAEISFRTMSLQSRGLFYTMRLECWVNQRLPLDQDDLAKILGFSTAEVSASLPAVMPFFAIDGEFIICPELEDYREHLAEQRRKQSQGGKTGSAITNSKRNKKTKNHIDDDSSTLPSTSTSNSPSTLQVPLRGTNESSVQSNTIKPSQNQFSNKRVVDDSFVAEYETAEQCTADDYCRTSRGY